MKADKTFTVTPSKGNNNNAPPNEIGIPIETQNANDGFRNIVNNNKTKLIPIAKLRYSKLIRSCKYLA